MPLFFCHCEVVVSSPKQSLLSGVTASLVCSFGEAVSKPDCFGASPPRSDQQKESLRGRIFASEAVSPFCSDKGVSLRARSIVCEAVSLFAQGLSLRGRSVVSEAVSLFVPQAGHCEPRFFVWRSNLLSHPVGIRDCFAPLAETTKRRSNLASRDCETASPAATKGVTSKS